MHAVPQETSTAPSCRLPCWCLVALVVLAGPLFLRMPLTNDAVLYDLQTRLFSEGAVPYRDILEPNLPGVFWVHSLVRAWLGDSSEMLRLFDLLVVSAVAFLLGKLSRMSGANTRSALWLGIAVLAFHLGNTEWCHCQRDTWMLLPLLSATILRLERLGSAPQTAIVSGIAEGLLWGAGVWLKPYALLVAAAVWIVTLREIQSGRRRFLDTWWVLLGGLLAALGGLVWLVQTEAWPYWLETMREWNPRYFAAGKENWVLPRFQAMVWRMQPWFALHFLALPISVLSLGPSLGRPRDSTAKSLSGLARRALSAIYLATMTHVFLLQHLFDYVHAPALILAIAVVGTWLVLPNRSVCWRLAIMVFGLVVISSSPILSRQRLRLWWACLTQPNNPKLQDRLALLSNPNRGHLERVADFLRRQAPRDGEVCVFNSDLVGLYQRLQIRPPTRYVYLFELMTYFPKQRSEILSSVTASSHRFVVTDLAGCGMTLSQALEIGPDGPNAPPPAYRTVSHRNYPWSHPVVFRSGTYLVHEVTRPLDKTIALTPAAGPDKNEIDGR